MNDTFSNRLKKAMHLRGIKQIELAKKCKIDKSLISNYVNGNYTAKQDNIHTLALVLDVDESWLMGYDVDMNRHDSSSTLDEVDKLYNENCRYLTKDDKATIRFIIENRIKERNDG